MTSAAAQPDWAALAAAFQQADAAGKLDAFRRRRWGNAANAAAWLAPDALPSLDASRAAALYRAAGGRRIGEFRANPIADIRDAVDFLLYDAVKLEARFEQCAVATAGFGLAGAGKEWPSYLLALRDPALFAPWSPHTERALRRLALLPHGLRQGHPGLCYIDLLDILGNLAARLRLPDFRRVDEFCYLNGRPRQT